MLCIQFQTKTVGKSSFTQIAITVVPAWDSSKVAAKAVIKTEAMPMSIETFTITVDDITINSAIIGLLWETPVGINLRLQQMRWY